MTNEENKSPDLYLANLSDMDDPSESSNGRTNNQPSASKYVANKRQTDTRLQSITDTQIGDGIQQSVDINSCDNITDDREEDGEDVDEEEDEDEDDVTGQRSNRAPHMRMHDDIDEDEEEDEEDDDDEDDNDDQDNIDAKVRTIFVLPDVSLRTISSKTASNSSEQSMNDHMSQSDQAQPHLQRQHMTHRNQLTILMSALDKLDPDKNGLALVSKDFTSSTLTTRLKGVCRINRLIDQSNELNQSFLEIGCLAKFKECNNKFRNWILGNKIIEYIFGPNCHVEIIKQSHTILSFVADSLEEHHVDVLWSASLLKHCGRQVLDILTSLVRHMRSGPVLHLYGLVKKLNPTDHSEHTLLLASHIIRHIWFHSPFINRVRLYDIQKRAQQHLSTGDRTNQIDLDPASSSRLSPNPQGSRNAAAEQRQQQKANASIKQNPSNSIQSNKNSGSTTGATNTSNADVSFTNEEEYQWLASCLFTSTCNQGAANNADEIVDRSMSSRSTCESVDMNKDLQQSLIEAIKGVTQDPAALRNKSPASETIAKGGGEGNEPADDMNQTVVDHILRSISDSGPSNSMITSHKRNHHQQQKQLQAKHDHVETRLLMNSPQNQINSEDTTTIRNHEWLHQWKRANDDFLDNTSDVSACCSEDKNMDDFDDEDESRDFNLLDDIDSDANVSGTISNYSNDLFSTTKRHQQMDAAKLEDAQNNSPDISASMSDRIVPNMIEQEQEFVHLNQNIINQHPQTHNHMSSVHDQQQLPLESIARFKELKQASNGLYAAIQSMTGDDLCLDVPALFDYNLCNLSEPGKTLLWDLLQDGNIEHLSVNLHAEIENVLVNLIMSFNDRFVRYRFIEACLENLSTGSSVVMSLRLLPRLMSFNTLTRNLSIPAVNETHAIVLWAEREYNMSQNFFKNLVDYYEHRKQLLLQAHKLLEFETLQTATTNPGAPVARNKSIEQLRMIEEYGDVNCKNRLFSHIDKIITRMSFLTFIYSRPFSPETMRLSRKQMDQLWDCLASDTNLRCSDVLFQWIYQQAVGDDFHGVNDELLDYILKHKLPTLKPENFRLRGLKLLEQLLWIRQDHECCHDLEHPATKLLWDIGLRAVDDEVSMAAIRIFNHFYIYTNHQKTTKCDKGINFMNHCMDQLKSSLSKLEALSKCDKKGFVDDDSLNRELDESLDVMQKVILLVRTHLEVFRAHWSFYLRMLQLNNEADLISHRLNAYEIKLTMTVRLVCQSASSMDKTTIEVQAGDFIGELRAEVVKWWYSHVDRSYFEQANNEFPTSPTSSTSSSQSDHENFHKREANKIQSLNKDPSALSAFTEFLLSNHHSLRLLSHNQEIPFDWDERQINELDFKDMQVIYVLNEIKPSLDKREDMDSNKSHESSHFNYVPKNEIPSMLLLRHMYFERLMKADKLLGAFQGDNIDLINRAKTLSRRVWEIIQILPTCPHYRDNIERCGILGDDWRLSSPQCSELLCVDSPQRLLYSLQIIDILKSSHTNPSWTSVFISKGGLSDLYEVFMSQKLLPQQNSSEWNEWLQECLAYLLKLIFQFGTEPTHSINAPTSSCNQHQMFGPSSCMRAGTSASIMTNINPNKRMRRGRGRLVTVHDERVAIPVFSDELLNLLAKTDGIFGRLLRILGCAATCKSPGDQYYYITMSSRAMIVHHVMSFLSSWCKTDPKFPKFEVQEHKDLLEALILKDPDPSTRREACNGLLKLHHACSHRNPMTTPSSVRSINTTIKLDTTEHATGAAQRNILETDLNCNSSFSEDLFHCLLAHLKITETMRPPKPIRYCVSENDYIRELNSPGCKDYFWLLCRLLDSPQNLHHTSDTGYHENLLATEQSRQSPVSLPKITMPLLCVYLISAMNKRQTYETRDYSVEDDTLRGMLLMMTMALRRDLSFKHTQAAYDFVPELYEYLFAAPNQNQRYLPKCKSPATRSTAFDLMLALVDKCPRNYYRLVDLLLNDLHSSVVKGTYPSDYWPHDDCRSEVGFVGLINLGATCYLATCMQHLFMIPNLRYAILSIEDTKNIRHGDIIRELQKIFTCLLESERKAYNPRNFCKVYTMDNHPLNIAEQTDMTEFLTDLITKLEESSPELRHIIKGIFSGQLSNNVVSLDCPHISRTTEEFYTLRVQVADMRNLTDSLDEITIKDTLEGDNMYTCSTCEKKVRAEKRACIVKLPRILCFNTMRYTFNMATMTKEKVNTHFSFPLKLDMAPYLEANLMSNQQNAPTSSASTSNYSSKDSLSHDSKVNDQQSMLNDATSNQESPPTASPISTSSDPINSSHSPSCSESQSTASTSASAMPKGGDEGTPDKQNPNTMYELIGVTVHTGNADGGHYYCFIRDCEDQSGDKAHWYLFNDAEVKPFDDSHIGSECYGGELTTKSYDALNDRFMDFSIEKTNSAYMLFYKRIDYEYHSKSVAVRYLDSDTQRNCGESAAASEFSNAEEKCSEAEQKAAPTDMDVETEQTKSEGNSIEEESRCLNALDFVELSKRTYDDFTLPKHLSCWVWSDNMKFTRDKYVFEHNYFNFMWQLCADIHTNMTLYTPTEPSIPEDSWTIEPRAGAASATATAASSQTASSQTAPMQGSSSVSLFTEDDAMNAMDIRTMHLAITFVLGVLMNSRERPNLSNWTELIKKKFSLSKAACEWLMQLVEDEESSWLKHLLSRCPIEMVKQLFQRLCNDLTCSKQHKKLRLVR